MAAEEAAAAYISDFLAVSGAAAASEKLMMTKWKERKLGQRKNAKRPFFPFPFPLCWTGGGWGACDSFQRKYSSLGSLEEEGGGKSLLLRISFPCWNFFNAVASLLSCRKRIQKPYKE